MFLRPAKPRSPLRTHRLSSTLRFRCAPLTVKSEAKSHSISPDTLVLLNSYNYCQDCLLHIPLIYTFDNSTSSLPSSVSTARNLKASVVDTELHRRRKVSTDERTRSAHLLITSERSGVAGGMHRAANPPCLKGFPFSALPCVAPYCVPSGVRVVSKPPSRPHRTQLFCLQRSSCYLHAALQIFLSERADGGMMQRHPRAGK